MEPYHIGAANASRAEAERWLAIAEKLLTGRDLIGSKTFAIRARESEPRLEAADQILAVADTLIAGDKRINNQPDWYAILQLPRHTQDLELIATHYRRLAILLNPTRTRLAFAEQAFQLVAEAWSVLSNPNRKSLYDNELNFFPMAMSLGQEQHEQHPHHYNQQQQQQPQPPPPALQLQSQLEPAARGNPRNNNSYKESEMHSSQGGNSTFWTACPYCFNMYEYPRVYEECSLRCQNCRRAFHGAKVAAPPIDEGNETYFSWGFYPLGVSMSYMEKNKGGVANWTPFSPMFSCPQIGGGKKKKPRRPSGPRIYVDDDDVFVDISESSEESDDEWGSTKKKKKSKRGRPPGRKKSQGEKVKSNKGAAADGLQGGSVMQETTGVQSVSNAETSRKVAANSAKKQAGKVPKEWGKLDLNVEFSNEVEEPASGMREGTRTAHGEEDGIEGIGFFEGLDEFLSSLPILNVVGDDKVKAA